MTLEVIYVVRHGFRCNWLVDPSTGDYIATMRSPTGIPADPALTAHGVDQAKELGTHLLAVQPPIDQVYSSPYYRCLQTVEPFVKLRQQELEQLNSPNQPAKPVEFNIRAETGLSEWYGSAPFEHPTSAPPQKLKELFPALDVDYSPVLLPTRKGESIAQLHDRVASAVEAIIDQCDKEDFRAVLLCSHAATVIALGRVLTGTMPDDVEEEDFQAFTCGLSVYRRRKKQAKLDRDLTGDSPEKGQGDRPHRSSAAHAETREQQPLQDETSKSLQDADTNLRQGGAARSRGGTGSSSLVKWRNGTGVGGGWHCELNSDCSFLSGGEERGWGFSGEESFNQTDQRDPSHSDAGMELGVVVQGRMPRGSCHQDPSKSRL